MDELLFPMTATPNFGPQRQPGLLGKGTLPSAPDMQMGAFTCEPLNIGGLYATDEYGAAMFLASELKSPDSDLNEGEREEAALMLRDLIANLYRVGEVSFDQMVQLQREAESIPNIGPLLFSAANLPGTVAGVGGMVSALSKVKSVNALLDMTPAVRKQLKAWAKTGGSNDYMKASRHFKGRIKLVRVNGILHFDIPVTAQAANYRILGKIGEAHAKIPISKTAGSLRKLSLLHGNGATGFAKVMGGNSVGALLAVGPQAYIDAHSSESMRQFLYKTAYSQPANVASFAVGAVVTLGLTFAGVPLIVIIGTSLAVGLVTQAAFGARGWDKDIGDFFTK